MSTATIQTVNLLPSYLQTSKNSKFLASTIDQLIQPPQLEKLNSYIGYEPPVISVVTTQTVTTSSYELVALLKPADIAGTYFSTELVAPRKEGQFSQIAQFNADDAFQGPYNLGFDWNMFGTIYNQVYIGTNGYLTFGGGDVKYTPLTVGALKYPAIYVEYTDLWEGYGPSGQPLSTGETPGIRYATGSIGNFKYFRMRFQGSHYIQRNQTPVIPAYDYECTLYSDGVNQYVENIYEMIPSTVHGLGTNDIGAVFGIANPQNSIPPTTPLILPSQSVPNNTSHVFYSTQNGGKWYYSGPGSFDPFAKQGILISNTQTYILTTKNNYITSTSTYVDISKLPTWKLGDTYIKESSDLRQAYQLEPALIAYDKNLNVTTVVSIDDLANEITIKGGIADNFDRLFRSDVYSFDPKIDWDKLTNYQNYYWLPTGPALIDISSDNIDVDNDIIGNTSYTFTVTNSTATFSLLNGMLISFSGHNVSPAYKYQEFIVEGTGTSITLLPLNSLITPESVAAPADETFDTYGFSIWPGRLPFVPEYVTINRSSKDSNPWSRYNRWFSSNVIESSELANGRPITYPTKHRAKSPIVEFNADIQLFNFGSISIGSVDIIDTTTVDAFTTIEGSTSFATINESSIQIDGIALEYGQRIIFSADKNPVVSSTIYSVDIVNINGTPTLILVPSSNQIAAGSSVVVTKGTVNAGTSWYFNGTAWVYSQQRTHLNEAPLFDLFDDLGQSYSNKNYYTSNWGGNKIFGYKTGITNSLFYNYFANGSIVVTEPNQTIRSIPTSATYFKVGNEYFNTWGSRTAPPIEITSAGYYDVPLSLTNNPLNSGLSNLTLSDLTEHAAAKNRLIASYNPVAFAMMFEGKIENSVIDAITKSADAYNQFKFSLLTQAANINSLTDPVSALDEILTIINSSKTSTSPYYLSDMLAFGVDKKVITYTVNNLTRTSYSISSTFDLSAPNTRSVLVYLNEKQLTFGVDYIFDVIDNMVVMLTALSLGDVLTINEYNNTNGSFVPPTPSKLGLYPVSVPSMYVDYTYVTPTKVIQGHDGSIMVAFNDYRDAIILEYELRVYNNIKVKYRPELFDINSVTPGAFRNTDYSLDEITKIVEQDFIRWSGIYGIDYVSNPTFNNAEPRTWNYTGSLNTLLNVSVNGSWRSIFKYFYDTDRPATHPWEMLGLVSEPTWWTDLYGPAPYTSGNTLMWGDIEAGRINGVVNQFYARPGLSSILPVDSNGNQLDPTTVPLIVNTTPYNIRQSWIIGDQGPAETVWRRSSFWPFVVQRLLALTRPANYCTLMYDPFNMNVDLAGQWSYGANHTLPQLASMPIHGENGIATTGYSVFVSEIGQQRTKNYIADLRQDLTYVNFQLFHKVGGFVNPDTLQIILDAYEPTTMDAGAILPKQNYKLILNTSNPIRSIGISGLIIQRINGAFVVTGYDRQDPYFTYYTPIRNANTPTITVGGVSAEYVNWAPAATVGSRGLTSADITSAVSAPTTVFYQQGQIVRYGNNYYRVQVSHQAETAFNSSLYQLLTVLPTTGGATVQTASKFNSTPSYAPYGQTYNTIQEVYDLIIGYGAWLADQGFVFNEFNTTLNSVVDWNLSAREFLYWSTQNWINNSIISISPFADQLTYQYSDSVVDNVFDSFYDYSIYRSDGTPFPKKNLFIARESGQFTINTINTGDGIYYARLNSVQKEHGMIFDNTTAYSDVIYDIETGQRQHRMKLVGFRTANWNGDFFAPGFVYDQAKIVTWAPNTYYTASDVVQFNGQFYSAKMSLEGSKIFDHTKWTLLGSKPVAGLIPNFDYKIRAFNDFYSLDIDSFDAAQQRTAQQLTGYVPRDYLNNIFTDPISQYKFYQGYIKEKGTKNPINKLSKASINNLNSKIDFNEEWAFRVGQYGSFTTYKEFETPLVEGKFAENPQIISFVNTVPELFKDLVYYVTPDKLTIGKGTLPSFVTTSSSASSFKLLNAGYAQLDDVTNTAFNTNSLITLANNTALNVGDTVWVSSTNTGDWDIYRYAFVPAGITNVAVEVAYSSIIFTTAGSHGLKATDLVSITNIDSSVNGIYQVVSVIGNTQFTVSSSLSSVNFIFPTTPGTLFTFKSSRFSSYDNMPSDQELFQYPPGTTIWIDSGNLTDNNGWAVYEKVNNYYKTKVNSFGTTSALSSNQALGYSISKRKGNNVVVAGLPTYNDTSGNSGRVSLYTKNGNNLQFLLNYPLSNTPLPNTEFGYSVIYDDIEFNLTTYGLIFAGAPGAYNSSGTIKISSINANSLQQQPEITIDNPSNTYGRFGSSIFVQRNTSTKLVLIGAPENGGSVYSYTITATNTIQINQPKTVTASTSGTLWLSTSTRWGHSIVGSDNASIYAIGAPGFDNNSGTVWTSNYELITSPFGSGSGFGHSMAMSTSGNYLAISAPNYINANNSLGAVAVYTLTNSTYILDQILYNPVNTNIYGGSLHFGYAMDFNAETDILIISSLGTASTTLTTFDKGSTTFDKKTTYFTADEPGSGSVYLYERRAHRYVYANELTSSDITTVQGTDYGTSVAVDTGVVLVGAPAITSNGSSSVHQFNQINSTYTGWNPLRVQDDLVVLDTIREIKLIDTITDSIVNYYDYHDPLKGKILGIAEEELTYKTATDPAIYSTGTSTVNVNVNTSWLDDHVGELWWDLSTAKFIWYEQGDLEYRRNKWGKLFPGASIDVYEWVGSQLLPSEWAAQADTNSGLTSGISGQPKFVDNSTVSVSQVYDTVTGSFTNYYYYWVLNKVVVPNVKNRRISAQSVANIIFNPAAAGVQYAAIISSNALMLGNVATQLVSDNISLNISLDTANSKIPRHTEWVLMQEGSHDSVPPPILERKMIESLLGHTISTSTNAGAPVPDPTLSSREKFGIGFRPQQTLFNDRLQAVRTIVEFANSVLINLQITGNYNFDRLNSQQLAPTSYNVVEDNNALDMIIPTDGMIVTVLSDNTYDGSWTVFKYNSNIQQWVRYQTQTFNTTLYWNYTDWVSSDYDQYKILSATVANTYELSLLSLVAGQYVKVNNRGDGNYIIVEKVNTIGNFNNDFDLVYIQNGTIQLSKDLWDSPYGWDETYSFDQTAWNRTPDYELQQILQALKDDIFINDLKSNWNLLFFKAIKYAFTETQTIDWAFKTSFISAINYAGELNQPAVYKLQDNAFYENYLNEVKPYHTQIREFTTEYSSTDTINTSLTDFEGIYTGTDQIIVPFRAVTGSILFDRVSTMPTIGTLPVTDTFIGDGGTREFVLSWVAHPNKSQLTVTIDDTYVLQSDYTVRYYSAKSNGYQKQFSNLKFLNQSPSQNSRIMITYNKSIELMDATDRIINFYDPTPGMPGNDLNLLMDGVTDPRKSIGGQYEGTNFGNRFGGTVADTSIDAGLFYNGKLINALGINPTDLTINGEYGFVTTSSAYGPEELIPGFTIDTLGIDVYTKSNKLVSPTIISGSFNVNASKSTSTIKTTVIQPTTKTGSTQTVVTEIINSTTYGLSILPTTIDSIFVNFNGIEFDYTDSPFTNSAQFSIDWYKSTISIPAQFSNGLLGYTIIGVGDSSTNGNGLIDNGIAYAANTQTKSIVSLANIHDITHSYVTVNGAPITQIDSGNNIYYSLNSASTTSNRAAATVKNLQLDKQYAVQAWFFASSQDKFNVIQEQVFPVVSSVYTLTNFVSNSTSGSPSTQVIVEYIYSNGIKRRLLPPDVSYYTVIDPSIKSYRVVLAASGVTFNTSNTNTNVYLNGSILTTSSYTFSGNQIVISNSVTLNVGDTVSVEAFNNSDITRASSNNYTYDYVIDNSGKLYLTSNITQPHPLDKLKVITFSNQDSLLLETQKFLGNPAGTYKMSRPVLNVNYVWVTIATSSTVTALTSGIDYQVLDDNITVKLSDQYPVTSNQTVIIMSFGNNKSASNVLAYRQFKDLLGGSSFTRLSDRNSTYLTKPLAFTHTEICVADASVLTPPDVNQNIPGVILVDGERIEFFTISDSNTLTHLRRATLGTSPSDHLIAGTIVIDQGSYQTISYSDSVLVQNTFTNVSTNTYSINTVSSLITYPNTSTTITSDGIILMTTPGKFPIDITTGKIKYSTSGSSIVYTVSTSSILPKDQLEIYYGGQLLKKNGHYYHDTTVNYDSILENQIVGTTATVAQLPTTSTIALGTAYLITATNQVWVYVGNRSEIAINGTTSTITGLDNSTTGTTYLDTTQNIVYWSTGTGYVATATFGYVDSGLRYVAPDFTIIGTSPQYSVKLNVPIQDNVQLTLVKKQYSMSQSWNDVISNTSTVSLLNSTGTIATFLQDSPGKLPNSYFYGGK